ncbi:hypothetical protein Clacol_003437 [Clathrus columnatus]|uniref:Uncharacterized protein n=1 Tax=Clathrus columnatus TaxID=1419009 RepID=A0AAV5A8B8_9AGAM|nr:hypothetical protein Clacol_003437 [Clathrus columnatus]
MPQIIQNAMALNDSEVITYSLQVSTPVNWNGNEADLLTSFLVYVPSEKASLLLAMGRDINSPLYQQPGVAHDLALELTSLQQIANPFDEPVSKTTSAVARRRKDALIGVSAAVAAIASCVLIWWLVRAYKRRLEKKHKRLSEYVDPSWAGGVYGTHNDDRRTSFFYAEDQLNAPVEEGGLAGVWGSRLRALAMGSRREEAEEEAMPDITEEQHRAVPVQPQSQTADLDQHHLAMMASLSRSMGGMPMPEMRQLSVDPPLMVQPLVTPPLFPPPGSIGANAMLQQTRRADKRVQSRTFNIQGPRPVPVATATTTALSRSITQPQKPLGPRIRSKRYSQSYPQYQLERQQNQRQAATEAQPQASSSGNLVQRPPLVPKQSSSSQPLTFPLPPQNPNANPQRPVRRGPIIRNSISAPIFQFSTVDI